MEAMNTRASLSPRHSEIEALIWEMKYIRNLRQCQVKFATYYSQLVKIVSAPAEQPAFENYLKDIKILQEFFHHLQLIHIFRTQNTRMYSLARSARMQQSFVVHRGGRSVPVRVRIIYIEFSGISVYRYRTLLGISTFRVGSRYLMFRFGYFGLNSDIQILKKK